MALLTACCFPRLSLAFSTRFQSPQCSVSLIWSNWNKCTSWLLQAIGSTLPAVSSGCIFAQWWNSTACFPFIHERITLQTFCFLQSRKAYQKKFLAFGWYLTWGSLFLIIRQFFLKLHKLISSMNTQKSGDFTWLNSSTAVLSAGAGQIREMGQHTEKKARGSLLHLKAGMSFCFVSGVVILCRSHGVLLLHHTPADMLYLEKVDFLIKEKELGSSTSSWSPWIYRLVHPVPCGHPFFSVLRLGWSLQLHDCRAWWWAACKPNQVST